MYPRRLLPGIAVKVPPPLRADALPRMDVALFVGFAARGPVHRPVAIDSVEVFQTVFGGDLVLAYDAWRGRAILAALAASVRGFFSNGGVRCWVIRTCRNRDVEALWRRAPVDGKDCASTRTFTIPGLGTLQAASVGSWSDGMRVSARRTGSRAEGRFMLRTELAGDIAIRGPFGFLPGTPDSWWELADDDHFYANDVAVAQARPLVAPLDPSVAWSGAALTDLWSPPVGPDPDNRTALERDGLSRFDHELFLDPDLALSGIATLGDNATRIRDLEGRALAGLHGVFAVPGGADYSEPSLIAVPDAAQCGWDRRAVAVIAPPQSKPAAIPLGWRDHTGSCALPPERPTASGPDTSRFLDCAIRLLPTPQFAQPILSRSRIDLSWSASATGATYIIEESGRADFAGAEEIWRGLELRQSVAVRREGAYYYRIHAELEGNVSGYSVTGVMIQNSAWVAREAKDFAHPTLLKVQQALLRSCAAIGDQFALLSLPRHFALPEATTYVESLTTALQSEPRSLSYGALYHPWLVTPTDSAAGRDLCNVPPEGVIAGTFARRAIQRGAWVAPANIPHADIVALTPVLADRDHHGFAESGVNLIRHGPNGFVASDAMTLSLEPDWCEVNVRRLMNLLRRVCIRQGAPFVFEPNGDVVQRAIERSFGHMLDDMVRRGAFSGTGGPDSYRLSIDASAADRMNGRIIVKLAVAPAHPLRFLTLVLTQAGERFSVAEER